MVDRGAGTVSHRVFSELPGLLRAGDVVVLNESRVVPARLRLRKPTGGAVEVTLLKAAGAGKWEALLRPSSRLRAGVELARGGSPGEVVLVLRERIAGARWTVEAGGALRNGAAVDSLGEMPLPPYIKREREDGRAALDRERYQTVYARVPGSVAAPTAGLHFSEKTLAALSAAGCETARIVLHVGAGTFTPVAAADVEEHSMEKESYEAGAAALETLAAARRDGRRIVPVGTTSVRVIETLARGGLEAAADPVRGETGLFIKPGFEFRATGAMLTNFHGPRTTPYVLVCALAGLNLVRKAYAEAIRERYRFLSYGDAMLVL